MSLTVLISIILFSLLFSAFFSGMEIAFITANKFRIELEKKQNLFSSKLILIFTKNPGQYIATMLVGNNIALVVYGLFFAKLFEPYIKQYVTDSELSILLIQTLLSTALILVTAEFLPKTVFKQNANFFLSTFSIPVFVFYALFYPIAKFTVAFSESILKILFKTKTLEEQNIVFGKIDLNDFLSDRDNTKKNAREIEHEVKIFKNALDFSSVKVRECIVPRNELIAVDINTDIETVTQKLIESKVSKILIYKDSIDNIIGYVNTLDIFKKPKTLKPVLNNIIVVPETMPANKLLNKLIKSHQSIALVVDEFGGTSGIITMEDIIEEIVGEIEDEHDVIEFPEEKISDYEFIFSGRIEIDFINEKYKINIPESNNYETIAGYILHVHEQIPDKGDIIEAENFKFEILDVEGPKIEKVKLTIIH